MPKSGRDGPGEDDDFDDDFELEDAEEDERDAPEDQLYDMRPSKTKRRMRKNEISVFSGLSLDYGGATDMFQKHKVVILAALCIVLFNIAILGRWAYRPSAKVHFSDQSAEFGRVVDLADHLTPGHLERELRDLSHRLSQLENHKNHLSYRPEEGIFATSHLTFHDIGVALLGSQEKVQRLMSESTLETIDLDGIEMHIHHHKDDENWKIGVDDIQSNMKGSALREYDEEHKSGHHKRQVYVEAGANIGMGTVYTTKKFPWVSTVSVEASPIVAFYLVWNMFDNGITIGSKHVVINRPIIDSNRVVDFVSCPSHTRAISHIGEPTRYDHDNCVVDLEKHQMRGITMKEVFDYSHSYTIDFVRMSCGGCELVAAENMEEYNIFPRIISSSGEISYDSPHSSHYVLKRGSIHTAEWIYCKHSEYKTSKYVRSWGVRDCAETRKKGNPFEKGTI